MVYEGFRLQKLLAELLPQGKNRLSQVHLIFTSRLFATWDEGNKRYHARASLYGRPTLISTSGVVEAPARSREYYLLRRQYAALGKVALELEERFRARFLGYQDPRLTEVLKGYVMQALFYHLVGWPFCEDRGCRLYNAHWQEELLFSQLESPYEFCQRHEEFLRKLATTHNSPRRLSFKLNPLSL